MNWLERTAQQSLLDRIHSWGWSEDQLRQDGVQISQRDNEFFIDLGDWAKVSVDDLKGAINMEYPGSSVDYEFEGGPEGSGWTRIF